MNRFISLFIFLIGTGLAPAAAADKLLPVPTPAAKVVSYSE